MATNQQKKTQGEVKMERYVNDLIRNKDFLRKIKKLRKNNIYPKGMYDTWTKEEQENHDYVSKELNEILAGYETLRKRCKKLMDGGSWKIRKTLSEVYGLDTYQIGYAECLLNPDYKDSIDFMKSNAQLDMCKISDFHDDELSPFNKGEEIIYLNRQRQLFLNAYPIAVCIHPKASKRDVIDFIEKRWKWIEYNFLRMYADKKLKYGKRKHRQEILDFLWKNRSLPSQKLKERFDKEFPKNGLAYFEITKIVQLEKNRRLGNLS